MRKIAALFPGQGSQYMGMCRDLIQVEPNISRILDRASETLKYDLADMIENASMKTLTMSENAQPAVVAVSYALYQLFVQELGVRPAFMAGHSLGEISALMCSGCISFEEGVTFSRERGKLMQQALEENKGFAGILTDIRVQEGLQVVKKVGAKEYVEITGYNSPDQLMVAGSRGAVSCLDDEVEKIGGQFIPFKMIPMKADAPYHSKLMSYLKPVFQRMVEQMTFREPQVAVYSTVTGESIRHAHEIPDILVRQLVSPVLWSQALHRISDEGTELFVDIGPGTIVSNLVREDKRLPPSFAFDSGRERALLVRALADPEWSIQSKMS